MNETLQHKSYPEMTPLTKSIFREAFIDRDTNLIKDLNREWFSYCKERQEN